VLHVIIELSIVGVTRLAALENSLAMPSVVLPLAHIARIDTITCLWVPLLLPIAMLLILLMRALVRYTLSTVEDFSIAIPKVVNFILSARLWLFLKLAMINCTILIKPLFRI
jgi:hypothetical protein